MAIEIVEPASLAVVANGTTEIRKLVAPFPAAFALRVSQCRGIRVCLQRLKVILEARIIGRYVAGKASVHMSVAELGHNHLLDARFPLLQRGALRIGPGQRPGLVKISR